MQRLRLLIVTLAHFCVDSYATMVVPALPFLSERLGFGLAFTGVLAAIPSVTGISQIGMGLWADRMRRRYLGIGGVALAALFTPLIGIASSYWMLAAFLAIGGVGVAAFHPQTFALAGELSGRRRSFGIALFAFGGTMALGGTPLWVSWFGSGPGMEYLPLVAIPGLVFAVVMLRTVPLDNPHVAHGAVSLSDSLRGAGRPLAVITLVVVLRSVSGMGIGTYIAFLGRERGLSALESGAALSAYSAAGVVGSLLFGYLADRFQPKLLTWTTILVSCPLLLGYVHLEGPLSYVLMTLGGGLLLASNSVLVALAQQVAPRNTALASSLPLGLAWGLAALALPPIGALADRIGLSTVLTWVALLPLVTTCVALLLPRVEPALAGDDGNSEDRHEAN